MIRKTTLESFRFLVKPPEEKPELLEQLAHQLGPHNAHFARSAIPEIYHREPDGHYVVVATRKDALGTVFRMILEKGFVSGGAHFPDTKPGKTTFVSMFQLAAQLFS